MHRLDIFINKKLNKHFNTKLFNGDAEIPYIFDIGGNVPPGFHPYVIQDAGRECKLLVKIPPEELSSPESIKLRVEISNDMRIAALVSLIKAAHLTMFSLLGYSYAASNAGLFVGHDILGRFFKANRGQGRRTVVANALKHFPEFRHMVRPFAQHSQEMDGTLSDGEVCLCAGTSGGPWGMIVFVKTAQLRNAVLLPFPGNAEAVVTFLDFLRNPNTLIHVMAGRLDREEGKWRVNPERTPLSWPKSVETYPGLL